MRSRFAKVCKHLLSIVACAIALGIAASEIGVESIRPAAVVLLEPAPPAPLAIADPRENEVPERVDTTPEPSKPGVAIVANQPSAAPKVQPQENTQQGTLDRFIEQAVSKVGNEPGAGLPKDVAPPMAGNANPAAAQTQETPPPVAEKAPVVPRRTPATVSPDELFESKTHEEPIVAVPRRTPGKTKVDELFEPKTHEDPQAPKEKVAMATEIEFKPAKSKPNPNESAPPPAKVEFKPAKSKPNPDESAPPPAKKVDSGQIVMSPPLRMSPQATLDQVLDNMTSKQQTASSEREAPGMVKKTTPLDGEEAQGAPPGEALPPFAPLENNLQQPAPAPLESLPRFPRMPGEKTSDLPSLPTLPPPPAFGPVQKDVAPPIVRKDKVPAPLPPLVPVPKDGVRTPTPGVVASQLLKENFMGLPKADGALPPPPKKGASLPASPVMPVSGTLPALPPLPPVAAGDVCDATGPIFIDPGTAEPPVVRPPQKNGRPTWLFDRGFSTALPQAPQVTLVSQRNLADSVFSSNQEKIANLVDMRKMITATKLAPDKEQPPILPFPPIKKDLPRMVGDPPLPPLPMDSAVLPVKAQPNANAVLLAKLPDPVDPAVKQAVAQPDDASKVVQSAAQDCPNCARPYPNNGVAGLPAPDLADSGRCEGCGRGDCVPGRKPCHPCDSHTILGGFMCDIYECICCPDPCYEGKWMPLTDSAFFVDAARPQSQMGFFYDAARHIEYPDRSEYFWARADGSGRGPSPVAGRLGEGAVRNDQLTMYTEAAVGGVFSTFISYPYLSVTPEFDPHAAGFGDLSIGTKTLLFDCELLLISFQMKTTIPTGNVTKGLGTGHVSLEPSLLFALKLSRDTYFQGQLAEWIPIGGDSAYEGSIFESRFSLNHVLCRILPDVPLVATLETNTMTFQHGNYTDPVYGPDQRSSGASYVTMGPGLRLFVCDRIDFGVGSQFAITTQHLAQTLVRVEFRFRY